MGAKYRFLGSERGIVFIEDLAQGMSITNDAENVWRRVYDEIWAKTGMRLVYKDTQGEWWEMVPTHLLFATGNWKIEFKRWHGHVWDILKGNV